jgi:hypothetical protein
MKQNMAEWIPEIDALTHFLFQFRHFAIQHQRFITLSKNDQRKLLGRNSSLYIQVQALTPRGEHDYF